MKAEHQFAVFLAFVTCVLSGMIFWMVKTDAVQKEPTGYTSIGANVTKVNDLEQGVVCYILDNYRALSCVPMRDK